GSSFAFPGQTEPGVPLVRGDVLVAGAAAQPKPPTANVRERCDAEEGVPRSRSPAWRAPAGARGAFGRPHGGTGARGAFGRLDGGLLLVTGGEHGHDPRHVD